MTDTTSTVVVPDVTAAPVGVPSAVTGLPLFFGQGTPQAVDGIDGGYFFDTAGGALWGPRQAGTWPAQPWSATGSTASASTLTLTAGAAIAARRNLMFDPEGSGAAVLADPTVAGYCWAGFAGAAASTGTSVQALRAGLLTDPTWAWTPLAPLFAAAGGLLTAKAPTTGIYHRLATAVTATTIVVAPEPVIFRA